MARTLSANVSAGIGGGSSPVWLIELESATTTYRWATADCNSTDVPAWTGDTFDGGRIARDGLGDVSQEIDLSKGGNIANLSDFSFSIRNEDAYSDTLFSENFLGRRCELRLIFIDKTSPSWANGGRVFMGYISEPPEWDEKKITFKAASGWLSKHKTLPPRIMTREQMPELPEENIGRRVPIVLGDFSRGLGVNRSGIASNRSPSSNEVIHRDYFPAYFDKPLHSAGLLGGAYGTHAIVADHELHTLPLLNQSVELFVWEARRKVWARSEVRAGTIPGPSGVMPSSARYSGLLSLSVYPFSGTPPAKYTHLVPVADFVNSSAGTANLEFAVDEDDSNYTELNANGEIASYEVPGVFGDGDETASSLVFWIDAVGRVDDKAQFRINGGAWTDCPAYGSLQTVTGPTPTNGIFTGARVEFRYWQIAGFDSATFRIRSVYLLLSTASAEPSAKLFQTGKGLFYEDWIDAPNHTTAKNSGDLIENPAAAVEALLARYLDINPLNVKGALSCGGTDALEVRDSDSFSALTKFTLSAWVYITESPISTPHTIFRKCNALAGQYAGPFDFYIDSTAHVALNIGNGATNYSGASSGTISPNTWAHVAASWDGTTIKFYINGAASGTATPGGVALNVSGVSGSIGGAGFLASSGLTGRIDELTLWDSAKDSTAISALYNSGSGRYEAGGQEGLVCLYHFDEGAGLSARDASGQNNDAFWYSGAASWAEGKVGSPQGVNEASFDDLHSNKTGLKLATVLGVLEEAKLSSEIIRAICNEFSFGFFENGEGLATLGRIEANGSPASIDSSSILVDSKGNSSLKITQGKLSDVRNEFHFYYKRNAGSLQYEGYLYCIKPNAPIFESGFCNFSSDAETYWTKCRDSYKETQQTLRFEIKLNFIRDDATAEACAKAFVSWFTYLPLFVSFEAPLSLFALELLDNKKIAHALLPDGFNPLEAGSAQFRLVGQRVSPVNNRLGLKFRSLPSETFLPPSLGLPSSLSPSLDLNADSLNLLDSDLVSSWFSDSGSIEFTAAGAARPTFKAADGPLGGAAVDFGGSQYMGSVKKLGDVATADGFSLFVVCYVSPTLPQDADRFKQNTLFVDSGKKTGLTCNTTPNVCALNNDGATDVSERGITSYSWSLFELHHASAEIHAVVNGSDATSAGSGSTSSLTGTLAIGADASGNYGAKAGIARLICYSGSLTLDERKLIREALNTLYGIY